jgi:hypothetical protein
MAYLCNQVLQKGRAINEFYRMPKSPLEMSNEEIKDYFATYGWVNDNELFDFGLPELIASPLNKPKRGREYRKGFSGNVVYFGVVGAREKTLFERDMEYTVNDAIKNGARFKGRRIEIDTYFNKVLEEACERGIIKLCFDSSFGPLRELINLRINAGFKRDTVQKRDFKRDLEKLDGKYTPSKSITC